MSITLGVEPPRHYGILVGLLLVCNIARSLLQKRQQLRRRHVVPACHREFLARSLAAATPLQADQLP